METKYDALGQPWQQSLPYRSGDTPRWSKTVYDGLGRVTLQLAPDGGKTQMFHNKPSRPPGAYPDPGETVRVRDAWGRERWNFFNALGQLVAVYDPDPAGSGSVLAPNPIGTSYEYNARGQLLTAVPQASPGQVRSFRYDSLGQLTHMRLPERNATLNMSGGVGGLGLWSDAFTYDARSNLVSATDARGVKTVFDYGNDPLNRLQGVAYDKSGFVDTQYPIQPAPNVSFEYETTGDVTRIRRITTAGVGSEEYGYDAQGRVSSKTLTLANRASYPF